MTQAESQWLADQNPLGQGAGLPDSSGPEQQPADRLDLLRSNSGGEGSRPPSRLQSPELTPSLAPEGRVRRDLHCHPGQPLISQNEAASESVPVTRPAPAPAGAEPGVLGPGQCSSHGTFV